MSHDDWLVGGDRRTAATERIYGAATELIVSEGLDAFTIDTLAAQIHCSRATVYRYAGGKAEIRDAVLTRAAADILESVRVTVRDLSGPDRVVTAIMVALERIRSDPLGQLMIGSIRGARGTAWLTASPVVAGFAADVIGLTGPDPHAAQWLIRVVLSLLFWPGEDSHAEYQMLQRFVGPTFAGHG
jgi:AcrR family transcriptional regulator